MIKYFIILIEIYLILTCYTNSVASVLMFKAYETPELDCVTISLEFEKLLNFAQKKEANIRWLKNTWDGDKIKNQNYSNALSRKIKLFWDNYKPCIDSNLPLINNRFSDDKTNYLKNPVFVLLRVMKSKIFHEINNSDGIITFSLNSKWVSSFDDFIPEKKHIFETKRLNNQDKVLNIYESSIIKNLRDEIIELQEDNTKNRQFYVLFMIILIFIIILIFMIIFYVKTRLKQIKSKYKQYENINLLKITPEISKINKKIEWLEEQLDKPYFYYQNIKNEEEKKIDNNKAVKINNIDVSVDQFLYAYHSCLKNNNEEKFITEWKPIYFELSNANQRMNNSKIQPLFNELSIPEKATYWFISNQNNKLLLPSIQLYKILLNSTISARKRLSDIWFKDIYKVKQGIEFKIIKPTVISETKRIKVIGLIEFSFIDNNNKE